MTVPTTDSGVETSRALTFCPSQGLLSALKLAKPGEGYPKEMCKQFDKMIEAVMELRSGESISIEQRVVNQCVELVRKSRWVWLYKDRKIVSRFLLIFATGKARYP